MHGRQHTTGGQHRLERGSDYLSASGGDLPTEAQWEYAARGGSRFPWSFGDNEGLLKYYAWYADNAKEVQAVGQLRPNPLGLYDMHGNAWEWVRDWYSEYVPGVEVDPVGPSFGKSHGT